MTRARSGWAISGLRLGERLAYKYGFTDDWLHDIRIQAIRSAQPGRRYPRS